MFNHDQIDHIYRVARLLATSGEEATTKTLMSSLVNLALQEENIGTLCTDIDGRWAQGKMNARTAQALKDLIQSIYSLEPEEKAQLPAREPQRTLAERQILAGKRANALRYANKLRGLRPEEIVAPPRLEDTKEETHVPAATAAATADV